MGHGTSEDYVLTIQYGFYTGAVVEGRPEVRGRELAKHYATEQEAVSEAKRLLRTFNCVPNVYRCEGGRVVDMIRYR